MRILDIGCARGDFTIGDLARKRVSVVGTDIYLEFLREARVASPPDCQFVVASASDMCFKEGSFDETHCHRVMEHLPNLEKALDGISKALLPGGKLLLSSPHPFLEKILGNLTDGDLGENMHRRVIRLGDLQEDLATRGFWDHGHEEEERIHTALLLLYRFILGMPFEAQSGLLGQGDAVTQFLEKICKWAFPDL